MDNTKEIFKPIQSYEGIYEVSNHGNIKTLERPIYRKNGQLHYVQKPKLLNPSLFSNGYYYVSLNKNKNIRVKTVHSIVAEAFIDNPKAKRTVNHIDGNKLNNNIENLEYSTDLENNIHALETGLRKAFSLIATNVKTGHSLFFESIKSACLFGFRQGEISRCCNGKQKTHKGYKFEYTGDSANQLKYLRNKQ